MSCSPLIIISPFLCLFSWWDDTLSQLSTILVHWSAFMLLHAFIDLHVYWTFVRVCFLTSWALPMNVTLVNVLVITGVSWLQLILCIRQYVVCIRLIKNEALFLPTSQNIVQCWFINGMDVFIKCVSVLTSWMTSRIHSFNSLEVSYVFVKFLLVFRRLNLCTLFILVGFNHQYMVIICLFLGLFGAFQRFPFWKLYHVNLYLIDVFYKLRTYELSDIRQL